MPSCIDSWISNKNESTVNNTPRNTEYSPIFIQLLANRNLTGIEEIRSYLSPSLKSLHRPELLPNIEEATDRVKKAILEKEKVLIFGDYDTDGIISTAMMYNFLNDFNINADYYIPDRFKEGYDINIDFLEKNEIEKKYDLVICVDCGSNAIDVQEHVLSGKIDIDIVACDHHEIVVTDRIKSFKKHKSYAGGKSFGKSSNCYIIINPKYPDSSYPFKMLSGGGVTFKFIWSILKSTGLPGVEPKDYLKKLLDLVAITTVADLMPLVDENRIIVNKGLIFIKKTKNFGLQKLLEKILENREEISTYDIGFLLSPRLNAPGRMEDATDSLKILINDSFDEKEIEALISKINTLNIERQKLQHSMLNEIEESCDFDKIRRQDKAFISKSAEWSEGILGVVASDIVKKHNIPAILFKNNKGILRGSGRSTDTFNLYENLELLKKHFIKFGGHQQACGITMAIENYEPFRREFIEIAGSKIHTEELKKRFYYDIEINFSELDMKLLDEIKLMEPFGIGNKRPLFLTCKCQINNDVYISKNEKHAFFQLKNSNRVYGAVMFNYRDEGRRADVLCKGRYIDILYNIEKNKNNNKKHPGIRIIIQSFR
jgi:single-stranded-DNA-specific exonuclease